MEYFCHRSQLASMALLLRLSTGFREIAVRAKISLDLVGQSMRFGNYQDRRSFARGSNPRAFRF
jgi:hypothetical protein